MARIIDIPVCEDCIRGNGEGCNRPECSFCHHPVPEIGAIGQAMLIVDDEHRKLAEALKAKIGACAQSVRVLKEKAFGLQRGADYIRTHWKSDGLEEASEFVALAYEEAVAILERRMEMLK